MPIRKEIDELFFTKWSNDMAYVLGFFAADGNMRENKRGGCFIDFCVTDREIIEKIRRAMKSNHKISIRRSNNSKWKDCFRLQIGSKKIFSDLTKLGFSENKSNNMKFPIIPPKFLSDFVRGYFDGDGCIYFSSIFARDRNKKRFVFSASFVSGSKSFLSKLKDVLLRQGIVRGGSIKNKERGFELAFSNLDSLALFSFLYNNDRSDMKLLRKYNKFNLAVKTLYPNRFAGVAQIG